MESLTKMQMLIKVMQKNPVVINDHTNEPEDITGLIEFNNPDKGLACCFDSRYYSLNECYLKNNNELHCSTWSIGGVLFGAEPDEMQLRNYNSNCVFDGGKIKCIHRPDGTKVYPAESVID